MDDPSLGRDLKAFLLCLLVYFKNKILIFFQFLGEFKSWLTVGLYRQRGRLVRPFIHSGMAFLLLGG
jgi:hypothetical protein